MHRSGEDTRTSIFGANRIFLSNGEWYFLARETPVSGPYASRSDADEALFLYMLDVVKIKMIVTELDDFDWSETLQ